MCKAFPHLRTFLCSYDTTKPSFFDLPLPQIPSHTSPSPRPATLYYFMHNHQPPFLTHTENSSSSSSLPNPYPSPSPPPPFFPTHHPPQPFSIKRDKRKATRKDNLKLKGRGFVLKKPAIFRFTLIKRKLLDGDVVWFFGGVFYR